MTCLKFVVALFLSAIAMALGPDPAQARSRHHHAALYGLPYGISYLHNYGPGIQPGTFAYYDGPSTNFCAQGSATYLGQDRRRHACF